MIELTRINRTTIGIHYAGLMFEVEKPMRNLILLSQRSLDQSRLGIFLWVYLVTCIDEVSQYNSSLEIDTAEDEIFLYI
jgi:hypothetical protein